MTKGTIEANILRGGAKRVMPVTPAVGVQAIAADNLAKFYGTVVHLTYAQYNDTTTMAARLLELGCRNLRTRLEDGSLGDTNTTRMLALRSATASQPWGGVKFLGPAGTYDSTTLGVAGTQGTPESLVAYLVAHPELSGIVVGVTGLNEPNLTPPFGAAAWPNDTGNHLHRLKVAIDAAPGWVGALPVYSPPLGGKAQADFTAAGAAVPDWGDNCDYGDYHLYQSGDLPPKLTDGTIDKLHTLAGSKSMITSEGGYHNAITGPATQYAVSEKAAAMYLPRLLLEQFLRSTYNGHTIGLMQAYHYELKDKGTATNDKENVFGLCRADWSRKPAFYSMARIMALVSDYGSNTPIKFAYSTTTAPTDLRQVLLQKRDGTFLLFLWRDVLVYDRIARKDLTVTPAPVALSFANLCRYTVSEPTTQGTYAASAPATSTGTTVQVDGGVKVLAINVLSS